MTIALATADLSGQSLALNGRETGIGQMLGLALGVGRIQGRGQL